MALRAAQGAFRLRGLRPAQLAVSTRGFAFSFDEKERGEERVYFNKEDQKLLEKLLNKVKKSNAASATPDEHAAEEAQLKAILGKDVDPAAVQALLAWKREH